MNWFIRSSVLSLVFLTQMALATPAVKLTGEFQFTPTVGHREPITGKDEVLFEDSTIAVINMKYDKPVYGKTDHSSVEQWTQTVTPAWTPSQLHLVFKLQGPPHKWRYVYVGDFVADDGQYHGTYFKVTGEVADIAKILGDGIQTVPATWKPVGTGTYKAVP